MTGVHKALSLFEQFKAESLSPSANFEKCRKLLSNLKVSLLEFESLPPVQDKSKVSQQEILLARETYELAALYSIKEQDVSGFEKHFAQAKMYYTDFAFWEFFGYSDILPASQRRLPLLGANLLRLLAQNRIAEFHMELGLVPESDHENVYIRHPVAIEQLLMEGAYNKILSAQSQVPAESYHFFMNMLAETARGEIADCAEKAYEKLSRTDLAHMMMVSPDDLDTFVSERKWSIDGTDIVFSIESTVSQEDLPSMRLIKETVAWAKELERIV